MHLFNRKTKSSAAIPTSSLPDIIFMLLFFFMVVTVMRPNLKIKRDLPDSVHIQKLSRNDQDIHFYVGTSLLVEDQAYYIQLNGSLIQIEDLEPTLRGTYVNLSASQRTVIMEIDEQVSMHMVMQIHRTLRKLSLRKILYFTRETPP